ncbi:DoxX family protein [Chitinophaga alhagiae]|uniref:DoxX family protein n=1 Tax=Chitinophaga alhagiae TaxID=2203219 RepID=UPI000E5C12FD|nr:DoxX family protein [Chitinophaga alhagiae]
MNSNNQSETPTRARKITYWVSTGLLLFELLYGATWDFNWLNKGFATAVLSHLGYPSYLPLMLGTCKIMAAIGIGLPGLKLVKEWAYAGTMILFLGALCSHLIVGDEFAKIIFLLVCIGLTVVSYCFRPGLFQPRHAQT